MLDIEDGKPRYDMLVEAYNETRVDEGNQWSQSFGDVSTNVNYIHNAYQD